MNIWESILIALSSVRTNKIRAGLTLLSISIGVFTIVTIGAMVNALENTVSTEMSNMGEHSFSVTRIPQIQLGPGEWRKYMKRKPISYSEVKDFASRMTTTNLISYHSSNDGLLVKHSTYQTNPDVSVIGCNEMYFVTNSINVTEGRPFSQADIDFNKNVAIIGNDIVKALFPFSNPLGQEISIKGQKFNVVGILEEKGAVLGRSQDNQVIVPVTYFLKNFAEHWQESLSITVRAYSAEALMPTLDEAIGILRTLRNVKPWEDNSFEIATNESLSEQFSSLTQYLGFFAIIIGGLALLAAGIGIMNIMLVSVKERTREIGIRKAVGAKKRWIMMQFIVETITLSELGALLGIAIGLGLTSLFASQLGLKLVLPVNWIILSIVFCSVIGLIFGLYPAYKAASLDPIDALRYE